MGHVKTSHTAEEIQSWLISQISKILASEPEDIDIREPFTDLGLSSREAVDISGELEDWLGFRLSPTLLYEYPDIETISQFLAHGPDSLMERAVSDERVVSDEIPGSDVQEIAVIGIGCRFPGANGPGAFRELLHGGVDAITEVPPDRWDIDFFYDPDPEKPGKMNTRWGGFLEQVDRFDAHFFGISPREAAQMDPQQRLLLEVSWEALEDAGQVKERLSGSKTGIFVGISTNEYGRFQGSDPKLIDAYLGTGNALSIAANRLSYFFNFRGPSIALDTACSSSLLAVHLACRSLSCGESTLALAGGVNLVLSPEITINFSKAGFMAPDGRCKAFDARADGYVRGEGVGMVVLKPLSNALADNDPVYAVIRGSAANQDGRSNGLTAPNRQAQQEVLREAFARAGVSPGQIQYIETHGTGTALGDPIEAKALGTVLAANRAPGNPCIIGSVKTNIGHLESAAGIAGLIKVALSLKHGIIPANLHYREPNPHIPFDELQLRVQQHPGPWPGASGPALAGVSAFGFGGTNVHVVLEEAPRVSMIDRQEGIPLNRAYLLTLSAQGPEALQSMAKAYKDFLTVDHDTPTSPGDDENNHNKPSKQKLLRGVQGGGFLEKSPPGWALHDICYTAALRRSHHDHRLALVGHSGEEMAGQLQSFLQGEFSAGVSPGSRASDQHPKLVFVFSGQGGQRPGMGQELLEQEPVFRFTIEECDRLFSRYAGWSLLEELKADESQSRLEETGIAQPAIFALQVALVNLWRSWGIVPDAVVGHSIGEVSAAHAAGVLTLGDAVRVVFHRARLMQQAAGKGKMAAVGLSLEETEKVLAGYDDRLSIAAVNSPASTVLSGEPAALEEVLKRLRQRNIFCRMLRLNYAFHCSRMDPFREELVQALQGLDPHPGSLPIYSTVTGRAGAGTDFDAAYWGRNIREPVRFAEAVDGSITGGHGIFLEIGPHPVLGREISQCLEHRGRQGTVLSCLCRDKGERVTMLGSLGTFYTLGYPVNWNNLYPYGGRCVALPSYPWQRKRYWFETGRAGAVGADSPLHPLLNHRLHSPLKEILFESRISAGSPFFLAEHRLYGMVVFPAAAYLEMALAAASETLGPVTPGAHVLEDVVIHEALTLPEDGTQTVQFILTPGDGGEVSFRIFGLTAVTGGEQGSWRLLVSGKIRTGESDSVTSTREHISIEELQTQCRDEWSVPEYYRDFRDHGIDYGVSFQGIEKLWRRDGEAFGRIRLPEKLASGFGVYQFHPVLLDACLQLFAAALVGDTVGKPGEGIYMPFAFERFRFHTRPGNRLWGRAFLRSGKPVREGTAVGDFILLNEQGEVAAEIMGVMFNRAGREVLVRAAKEKSDDWLYEIEWKPETRVEAGQAKKEIQADRQGSWLIFSDRGGVGGSLAELLQEQGEPYVMVFPGETFANSKQGHFEINPAQPGDFQRLLKEAYGDGQRQPPCQRMVHLWSLDAAGGEETTVSSLKDAQVLSCGSVLHLVQALAAAGLSAFLRSPRLWLVTRGAQPVGAETGPGSLSLAQAPLWGLGNVIALEHPKLHPVRVDLDPLVDDPRVLFEEIRSRDQDQDQDREQEDQIAFRGGVRYVPRLVFHDSSPLEPPGAAALFPLEGTYLITGGLGGLGLKVAQWLVEQGVRHLVLMGRRGSSDAAREVLDTMSQAGARVVVVKADVTQEEQVAGVLAEIRQSMPPLKGIFHAAGVLEDSILVQQKWEDFAKVMAPKVEGAWILHALTRDMELDFFVLFSSATSLLGWLGQGNYAAGNAFLDGLAHYRQKQGLAALSINWGPWAEVGMAAGLGNRGIRQWRTAGIGMIAPEQGLQVLGHMLGQLTARVTVLPIKWSEFMRQFAMRGGPPPLFSRVARGLNPVSGGDRALKRQSGLVRRIEAAPPGEKRHILAAYIRDQVVNVLRLDSPDSLKPQQGLFELGMDSIMAVELKNRLEVGLGRSLPAVLAFNYPTIEALAEYLAGDVLSLESPAKPGADKRKDIGLRTGLLEEIKQLSDTEVEAMIEEELEALKRGE